jgi:Domain of unknown function (DUF4262)
MENEAPLTPDEFMGNVKNIITQHGWCVLSVFSNEGLPDFSYTVGLWETYQHPEILVLGFKQDLAHPVLNEVGELIKAGQVLKTAQPYHDVIDEYPVQFLNIDQRNIPDYLRVCCNIYGEGKFPAMQLVWPDKASKFPWEEDFNERLRNIQVLLDRNADFKFYEERNLGVYTMRSVMEGKKPILRVVHDEEGDWQFLSGDEIETEEAMYVCLEEVIKLDPSLNELFDLGFSVQVERTEIGGKWTTTPYISEE